MTGEKVVPDGWLAWGATPLERRLYAFCLGVVCVAYIAPLWVGEIPPLTDFGATLNMVEVYSGLEENALFEARFTRNAGLLPNLLVAQVADALAPTVSPMTSLRLLLSLSILGVAGGLLLLTWTFGRSPWMVFLGMPVAWSGIFALGMVGFSLSLPLILFMIAAGASAGRRGGVTSDLALLLIGLLAFSLHGMGYVFVAGFGALSLGLHARSWRRRASWVCLLPSALLWLGWSQAAFGVGSVRGAGFGQGWWWRPWAEQAGWLWRQSHDVLVSPIDSWGVALLGLLGLALGTSGFRSQSHTDTRGSGRALLWLTAVAWLGVFLLPASIRDTGVSSRLLPVALWLLSLLPKPDLHRARRIKLIVAALVMLNLGYGFTLTRAAHVFSEQEVEPLMRLLERVPLESRVSCVEVCEESRDTIFLRRPICHACAGLVAAHRDGFSGGGFASLPHNPIRFRAGAGNPRLSREPWFEDAALPYWQYVIERGTAERERGSRMEWVATEVSGGEETIPYSLYRVRNPIPESYLREARDRAIQR